MFVSHAINNLESHGERFRASGYDNNTVDCLVDNINSVTYLYARWRLLSTVRHSTLNSNSLLIHKSI